MDADTIFAVASGAGQAAIAVMRLSGRDSHAILASLCGRVPPPRRASFRRLRDAAGSELDQGVVVWLPGPGSYTGEDTAAAPYWPVSPTRWWRAAPGRRSQASSPAAPSSTAGWT